MPESIPEARCGKDIIPLLEALLAQGRCFGACWVLVKIEFDLSYHSRDL